MIRQISFVIGFLGCFLLLPLNQAFAVTFSISTEQTTISKDDEVAVLVKIADITSCTKCYLQAAFTASLDNPKYLGQTQNNTGSWYIYGSNPTPDTIKSSFYSFEPTNSAWIGTIKTKIDTVDSDYKGAGNYYLKVARYTGNSSSGSWADDPPIQLIVVDTTPSKIPTASPSPVPSHTPKPTATPKPSSTPKPTVTPKPSSTPKPSPTSKPISGSSQAQKKTIIIESSPTKILPTLSFGPTATVSAEILGASTTSGQITNTPKQKKNIQKQSNEVKVLGESSNSALFIMLGGILLILCAILGCWKYIKRHQQY